ncbi:MAG: hypothetical protein WAM17_11600 [Rhodoplanes sp.]
MSTRKPSVSVKPETLALAFAQTGQDRKRLEALYEKNRGFVTGAQMGWFKRICKQLGEMEE